MFRILISFILVSAFTATPAMAYVGPGSSLSAIGVVFGLIGTIFLSLLSFVWYPIKRVYRRVRRGDGRDKGSSQ